MAKRIVTPFAEAGDRASMPDTPSGTDSNYQTGYPAEYEEDPLLFPATAKFPERNKMNQLYNDITANVKEWQEHVYPEFITTANNGGVPFSYRKGSIVVYLGVDYVSLEDANEDVPTTAKWLIYAPLRVQKAAEVWLTPLSVHPVLVVDQDYPDGGTFEVEISAPSSTFIGAVLYKVIPGATIDTQIGVMNIPIGDYTNSWVSGGTIASVTAGDTFRLQGSDGTFAEFGTISLTFTPN